MEVAAPKHSCCISLSKHTARVGLLHLIHHAQGLQALTTTATTSTAPLLLHEQASL